MKKIIFFFLFFAPTLFAMQIKKIVSKINQPEVFFSAIPESEIKKMYEIYKEDTKKFSLTPEAFEEFKYNVLDCQDMTCRLEEITRKLKREIHVPEKFIPDSIIVDRFVKSNERFDIKQQKIDMYDKLHEAKTHGDLLLLSQLQYKLGLFILETIDRFDSPAEEFTSYRICKDIFNKTLNPKGIDGGEIIQEKLSLLHMLNYIEATQKCELNTKKLYNNTAKSIVGIRPFLTELAYHPTNHLESGPKFDKKFIKNFDGTSNSIKEAKKKLTENFECLFWILRLIPADKSKVKFEESKSDRKKREYYFNSYVVQNHYYCTKKKCVTCGKPKEQDEEHTKISKIYFPDDMDDKIKKMNLKKAKQMKQVLGYQPTKIRLNPCLAPPKEEPLYYPDEIERLKIHCAYGLFDGIKFDRDEYILERKNT